MSEVLDGTDDTLAAAEPAASGVSRREPELGPESGGTRLAAARRWLRSHAIAVVGVPTVAVTLFWLYLRQSRTVGLNSDASGNALQAWDMLHGNLLLSHWTLSDVSFYLTELPQYLLVEAVNGLNGDVVHVAAALSYTLAVLLAAWLARGRATGREAFVRVLIVLVVMLAPGIMQGTVLTVLSSPDHFGTAVPLLLIFVAVDRLPRRRYTPVLLFLLLTWAGISDSTVILVGCVGIASVAAMRLWQGQEQERGDRRYEAGLLGASVLAAGASAVVPKVIHASGGFLVHAPTVAFNPASGMSDRVWQAVGSFLQLFGADFFGLPLTIGDTTGNHHSAAETVVTLLHLVGAVMVIWALVVIARRLPGSGDRIAKTMTVGILLNLTAFVVSTEVTGGSREIATVLPLGAALAGRVLGARVTDRRTVAVLGVLTVGFAAVLVRNAAYPSVPGNGRAAAVWLKQHGYMYGLGGYWSSHDITVESGDAIQVRPVDTGPKGIQQYGWESKSTWYDPSLHYANFLVVDVTNPIAVQYAGPKQAAKQFGPPVQTVLLAGQEILIWNKNLLETLPSDGG